LLSLSWSITSGILISFGAEQSGKDLLYFSHRLAPIYTDIAKERIGKLAEIAKPFLIYHFRLLISFGADRSGKGLFYFSHRLAPIYTDIAQERIGKLAEIAKPFLIYQFRHPHLLRS
jgi:capsid portal protein